MEQNLSSVELERIKRHYHKISDKKNKINKKTQREYFLSINTCLLYNSLQIIVAFLLHKTVSKEIKT